MFTLLTEVDWAAWKAREEGNSSDYVTYEVKGLMPTEFPVMMHVEYREASSGSHRYVSLTPVFFTMQDAGELFLANARVRVTEATRRSVR